MGEAKMPSAIRTGTRYRRMSRLFLYARAGQCSNEKASSRSARATYSTRAVSDFVGAGGGACQRCFACELSRERRPRKYLYVTSCAFGKERPATTCGGADGVI